ncbi:hypothetical protein FB565_008128 [Actinoplanes lutulentus]|uniref:Uncharacterized protein n=1 Tax=Actinoplanes lutulentus TaxID=1287878 RepID=A0A327Z3S1_9ACTN|nr:hypothetical protein [Actinoplanes lutulentus]MBB2948345.1 hypothetical protein [Actinoplanes lutulentus]RAK30377.1 hypothetical protein B0I29_11636 [Actinoplanes lutulentus]
MTDNDLERRLRAALSARATTVTSRDLRYEPVPSRAADRSTTARWWLPLAAGLAAATVSITAFALLRPAEPTPMPPASPASPAAPDSSGSPAAPASPTSTATSGSATSPARPALPTSRLSPTSIPERGPSVTPPTPERSSSTAEPQPTASEAGRTVTPTTR